MTIEESMCTSIISLRAATKNKKTKHKQTKQKNKKNNTYGDEEDAEDDDEGHDQAKLVLRGSSKHNLC